MTDAAKGLRRRWAEAIFAHPDKPIGAVAMAFVIYMRTNVAGEGQPIEDGEFARACGVTDRRIRTFKKWLVDAGFVAIAARGTRGRGSVFHIMVPDAPETQEARFRSSDMEHRKPASSIPDVSTDDRKPASGNRLPTQEARFQDGAKTGSPLPVITEHWKPASGHPPRVHARKESPSGILSTLEVKNPPKPPTGASDDLKKTNVQPVDSFSVLFADPVLNEGIEVVDGSVRLVNGTRAEWLKRFAGDEEALDLAVMEAAGGLQPNSKKPIKPQIERVLARIVRESRDKDKRYAKAAEKNRSESRQQRKSSSESIMEKVLPYTRLGQAHAKAQADEGGQSQSDVKLIDGRCQELN